MIIGLTGRRGSGKTSTAREIAWRDSMRPAYVASFAEQLRVEASRFFGVDYLKLHTAKDDPSPVRWSRWQAAINDTDDSRTGHMTYRQLLQAYGQFRRRLDCNYWVDALWRGFTPGFALIIDDVRMPNEARSIVERGGLLFRLTRDAGEPSDHASDTALDHYPGITDIDNSSLTVAETADRIIACSG